MKIIQTFAKNLKSSNLSLSCLIRILRSDKLFNSFLHLTNIKFVGANCIGIFTNIMLAVLFALSSSISLLQRNDLLRQKGNLKRYETSNYHDTDSEYARPPHAHTAWSNHLFSIMLNERILGGADCCYTSLLV